MAKLPTTETIAAQLTVPERVLLFCLVERDHATDFALTDQGRSVLDVLGRKAHPG